MTKKNKNPEHLEQNILHTQCLMLINYIHALV